MCAEKLLRQASLNSFLQQSGALEATSEKQSVWDPWAVSSTGSFCSFSFYLSFSAPTVNKPHEPLFASRRCCPSFGLFL
jgi:hypothetical protein